MKEVKTKKQSFDGANELLLEVSKLIEQFHPTANISSLSIACDMGYCVDEVIRNCGLNRKQHLKDLLIYSQKFKKAIRKKYGFEYAHLMHEDLKAKYNFKPVPQNIQVQRGILDLLIGRLNTICVDVSAITNNAA